MKTTHYEIDMLNVGAADAILIRFFDENDNQHVVLVDAGHYEDGKRICDFVREKYGTFTIDLAICTHSDEDHIGGFTYILNDMLNNPSTSVDIKKILINDPGDCITADDVKWYENTKNVIKEARKVYDNNGINLLELINKVSSQRGLKREQAFSNVHNSEFDGIINIVGPSNSFYRTQALQFRNKLEPYDYVIDNDQDDAIELPDSKKVFSKKLIGKDPSHENKSSIIFLFEPSDGKKFLFTGDADGESFDNILYDEDRSKINNVYWMKLPHHGSAYNLDNDMVNYIKPKIAYVSTEKFGKYLDHAVVGALKKAGTKVYSTRLNGNMWYHNGTPKRVGYTDLVSE